jgi:hypothetical protein
MSKKIVFTDIHSLLEMIRDQVHIIESYEGKIPQIELDIIMSNIRRLYDDFYEVNYMNRQIKAEINEMDQEIVEDEPQKELVTIISKVIPPEEPQQEVVSVKEEPESHQEQVIVPKKEEPVLPIPEKKTEKVTVPKDLFAENENITLADKFKDDKKTFHEKLSVAAKDKSIADTIQKPIGDLRTGIGVNDRFVFINELFGGSMADYQAAIEEINKQADLEAATRVVMQYKQALNWKEGSEALSKLMSFIRRRYC